MKMTTPTRRSTALRGAAGAAALALLLASGCSWIEVPESPAYAGPTLPLRVGVRIPPHQHPADYAPRILRHLRTWGVFESFLYPLRPDDEVDAVLRLTVRGRWNPEKNANFWRGFLIGTTLGIASPWVGIGMTGRHELEAVLTRRRKEVARYRLPVETRARWGLGAGVAAVAERVNAAQVARLAHALAARLRADWPRLRKTLGK